MRSTPRHQFLAEMTCLGRVASKTDNVMHFTRLQVLTWFQTFLVESRLFILGDYIIYSICVFVTVGLETEEESALRSSRSNGYPSLRGDPSLTVWSCAL